MYKSVRISLTEKCNYNCFFCHNEGNAKNLYSRVMTLERLDVLFEACRKLQIQKFTITGGEPFLNKDIVPIIQRLKQAIPEATVNIASNLAIARKEQLAEIVPLVHKFNVNFQSLNASKFKEITRSNSLENVIEKIAFIKSLGGHVTLNSVYTKKNASSLKEILEFSKSMGCNVKILELVAVKKDFTEHQATNTLKKLLADFRQDLVETYFVNNSDEVFKYPDQTVRLIHSYDNTQDLAAQRLHGEIRITPEFDLRPSLNDDLFNISLLEDLDKKNVDAVTEKIRLSENLYFVERPKLVSVMVVEHKDSLVLVKRNHGDHFSYETPGGHIEENETPAQAAIRETKEESGLDVHVQRKCFSFYHNGKIAHYFKGHLLDHSQLQKNPLVEVVPISDLGRHKISEFAKSGLEKLGYSLR